MHRYEVGKLYVPGRTSWPEAAQYNFRGGEHGLELFWPSPRPHEIEGIKSGPVDFALVAEGDVMLILYRIRTPKLIEVADWSDAPYTILKLSEPERIAPPRGLAADQRVAIDVTLVDADTGIVKVLRKLSWSPTFTSAVHAAIIDQLARPYPGDQAYQRQLDALYRRFPHSRDLLAIALERTTGGT